MHKLLKPKDLDVLPTDANAASVFKYWIAIFESFLQAVETVQAAIDPSVEVNRRGLLVNFLTSAYQYIEDCETYEAAVAELKRVYVRTKNNVFARHLLATRRQLPGESLQQFLSENFFERLLLQSRYRLAVPLGASTRRVYQRTGFCCCATKTSEEGRSFSLEAALEQAYSLERAQQQLSSYSINVAASNVVLQHQICGQLAGADVGSAYDPVSDRLPHGLAAVVEKQKMLLLRKAISQTFAMPCSGCNMSYMPKEVIMPEFACLRINLYRPELLLSLKAVLPR